MLQWCRHEQLKLKQIKLTLAGASYLSWRLNVVIKAFVERGLEGTTRVT